MDTNYSLLPKCPSLSNPSSFNGNHYVYWKQKMTNFIETTNIDIWDIVEYGYKFSKILIDGVYQPKVKSFWTKKESIRHLLASKVKWIMTNFLTPNEYEIISNYKIVKEVWNALEATHIGTTQVRALKVHMLVSQYEIFKMEEGKSIKGFIQRLQLSLTSWYCLVEVLIM